MCFCGLGSHGVLCDIGHMACTPREEVAMTTSERAAGNAGGIDPLGLHQRRYPRGK